MVDRIGLRTDTSLPGVRPAAKEAAPQTAFAEVLAGRLQAPQGLRFSAHAQQRLDKRGIALGPAEQAQLADAVQRAADKGARESLIVMNEVAYVVSVPNRTVITALPVSEAENQVFTNIDSVVLTPAVSQEQQEQATRPDPLGGLNAADRLMRRL
jgi:flagellar operon protein